MKDIRLIVKFHEFFMKQHRLFGKFRYGTFPSSGYQFSREIQIWYLESKSIQLSFLLVKFTERKLFIINTYARVSIYGETNFTMMMLVMTVIRNSLLMLSNLTKYVGLYKTKNDHVSSHTKTMRNSEAEEKYWAIETKKKQYRMEKIQFNFQVKFWDTNCVTYRDLIFRQRFNAIHPRLYFMPYRVVVYSSFWMPTNKFIILLTWWAQKPVNQAYVAETQIYRLLSYHNCPSHFCLFFLSNQKRWKMKIVSCGR